jgi:hypothetical protein
MKATPIEEQSILECYRRLFKVSTPFGDFDELLAQAEKNDIGQKVIPFMDYEIEESVFTKILQNIIKEFKIKKYRQNLFQNTILLGCAPKFKKTEQ